jgi:rod shape-determining protein MreC
MATQGTGLARRRANLRRGAIATLVVACLALFSGYFRESGDGPLHGVQSAAAGVVAPIQDVATEAVQPFRDAWGWVTSLKDARDRAARLEEEVEALRGAAIENRIRDEQLARLRALVGVGRELDGYEPVVGTVIARSFTSWYRSARLDVGRDRGVVQNSPVVAGTAQGAALVGIVTSVRGNSADVSFITDGRTSVGATIPEADSPPGLLESTVPGQLRLAGIPREFPVREGQAVVTAGFNAPALPSVYPYGIPVGQVTSVGGTEVDVERTVQVTPYADPRSLPQMVVLTPQSPQAKRRAEG